MISVSYTHLALKGIRITPGFPQNILCGIGTLISLPLRTLRIPFRAAFMQASVTETTISVSYTHLIQGDWKYIEPSDKPALEYWTKIEMGNAPQPQLYNRSIDPSEKDNVAEAHPDKVKTLSALLEEVKEAKNQSEME